MLRFYQFLQKTLRLLNSMCDDCLTSWRFLFLKCPLCLIRFQYTAKNMSTGILYCNRYKKYPDDYNVKKCAKFCMASEWRKKTTCFHYKSPQEICFRFCEFFRLKNDNVSMKISCIIVYPLSTIFKIVLLHMYVYFN